MNRFFKGSSYIFSTVLFLISAAYSPSAHSIEPEGFTDSFWFEPGLACALGAAGGYSAAPPGEEIVYSSVGCALTGGAMYLINSYYQNKVATNKDRELEKLRGVIRLQESIQAEKAARGTAGEVYSLRVQEVVPAQRLPDGSIMAPTIKENLIIPNQDLEVGY